MFSDCEWDDAAGHIALFDGKEGEGNGYFDGCGMALLYELK
nr:hypothetical protein [Prevotella sp. HMSC073D09]